MEATHPAIDSLKNVLNFYVRDIEALPDDAVFKSLGGKARTVADIVYEVNLVNDHIGQALRGEPQFEWPDEQWIKAPVELNTKAALVAAFKASLEKQIATLESFLPDNMDTPIVNEGKETTPAAQARFMGIHLWYHLGQINFVQTLVGDEKMHWHD